MVEHSDLAAVGWAGDALERMGILAAALALSVRINGLSAEEVLVAGTANAACAVGLKDVGKLEEGCAADFLVLESSDWRDLLYTLGANPVREVWTGGRRVEV